MTQLRYDVNAHITPRGDIALETTMHEVSPDGRQLEHMRATISRKLVDMENEALRTALIGLGWMPPAEDPPLRRRLFPDPPPDPVDVAALCRAIANRTLPTVSAALVECGWIDMGHGIWKEPA